MPTQADNSLVRVQSIKVYDDEGHQKFEANGRNGERFGGTGGKYATPRVQNYGMTAHPPEGSLGITGNLGGNPTNAMITNMEHPDHRPNNLEEGEVKVYDMWDHYMYLKEDEWYTKVGPCEIWYKDEGGAIKIKVGGAIIDMSEGGTIHLNP